MRLMAVLSISVMAVATADIAAGAEKQEQQGLIQKEMVALDRAFKITIDALVLNELERIVPAFDEVHTIREQIEHAIKAGEKVKLPRHQKRFKEFVRLDNKFHHELEVMLKAAKKNKIVAVKRQAQRLLDACVRCHNVFRK